MGIGTARVRLQSNLYKKRSSNLVPDTLSRSNKTTKLTASVLAYSVEKPKVEINDETDDWYSAQIRRVGKRP